MTAVISPIESARYARCVEVSKRIAFEIDRDVIRGRRFDFSRKFLPDGLSLVGQLAFLSPGEQRLLSQIQGRTYANVFGLVERFIGAKVLEVSRQHWLGDQNALEALVRFAGEEIKHQELFRRIEELAAEQMPPGYRFVGNPNAVAALVLQKSSWAVLALTCHIELFVQLHYRQSIDHDQGVSDLWKDVFKFHWMEESQHAILDELEWRQEDAKLDADQRDAAVTELIELVAAVDGLLQEQAMADGAYFAGVCGRMLTREQVGAVQAGVLKAYRWQYIASGVQDRFSDVLGSLIDPTQAARVGAALAPMIH